MAETSPDPLWLRGLNSPATVAFITVVVGGILGNMLLKSWDAGAKEREQVRAVAKQTQDAGMAQVERAFGQAGAMIAATENLETTLADSAWNPSRFDPDRALRIKKKRDEIVTTFNDAISTWQKEREQIALMITYLMARADTADDPGDKWRVVQGAVDAYLTCVKTCYAEREKEDIYEKGDACAAKKDSAWLSLRAFAKALPHASGLSNIRH